MYYYTYIEDFVKNLYKKLEIFTHHQIDMFKIAKRLNISIAYWDEKSEANFVRGKNRIFLNNKLSIREEWLDFGHELSHVLMHCGNQSSMSNDFVLYQEVQANSFMFEFCVPTFMLFNSNDAQSIEYPVEFIYENFNVTKDFAFKRGTFFKSQVSQARRDDFFKESLTKKSIKKRSSQLENRKRNYSNETIRLLNQLKKQTGVSL